MTNKKYESLKTANGLRALHPDISSVYVSLAKAMVDFHKINEPIQSKLSQIAAEYKKVINIVCPIQPPVIFPLPHENARIQIKNSLLDLIRQSNLLMTPIVDQFKSFSITGKMMQEVFLPWQDSMNKMRQTLAGSCKPMDILRGQIAEAYRVSLVTESLVWNFPADMVGNSLNISSLVQKSLGNQLAQLFSKYSELSSSFGGDIKRLTMFPPVVSVYPPFEIFNAVKLASSITVSEKPEPISLQEESLQKEIQEQLSIDVEEDLSLLNSELSNLWIGARQALKSGNQDRKRHVTVSLRELINHILHYLAPDEKIIKWTQEATHFHNGKPTRKARILFICRKINEGNFIEFVESDIRATLKFIELFQEGTHRIDIPFTDEQLKALLIRAESLLHFCIRIHRESEC